VDTGFPKKIMLKQKDRANSLRALFQRMPSKGQKAAATCRCPGGSISPAKNAILIRIGMTP
jgi:hypothetical protein